jgi:hypothetical protein
VKTLLYATIVLKEMALLTLSIDRNEPMTENSSGAVKSGFWNPVYQNNCEGYLHPEDAARQSFSSASDNRL